MTEKNLFGRDNGDIMPPAFRTDHGAWDDYISTVWAGVIAQHMVTAKTIIEIGPGVSTKIGGALKHFDFDGTLYVVDVLHSVIEKLKPLYEMMLPRANIIWITGQVSKILGDLPDDIDMVLGNHILDDMMIFDLAGQDAIAWSESYAHHPHRVLKNNWQNLKNKPAQIEKAKESVTKTMLSLFQSKNVRTMILNQYPSATLKDHDMNDLNIHACDILDMLKRDMPHIMDTQDILNNNIHYRNEHIGHHVLNARYWITCKNA